MHSEVQAATPRLCDSLPGANPAQALSRFFPKAFRFKGMASRSEFWWVELVLILINVVLVSAMVPLVGIDRAAEQSLVFDAGVAAAVLSSLNLGIMLVTIVPSLSLLWRRLHDGGFAGPWAFIVLIPLFGWIALIIMTVYRTNPGAQKRKWDDPERWAVQGTS